MKLWKTYKLKKKLAVKGEKKQWEAKAERM